MSWQTEHDSANPYDPPYHYPKPIEREDVDEDKEINHVYNHSPKNS